MRGRYRYTVCTRANVKEGDAKDGKGELVLVDDNREGEREGLSLVVGARAWISLGKEVEGRKGERARMGN